MSPERTMNKYDEIEIPYGSPMYVMRNPWVRTATCNVEILRSRSNHRA